VSDTVQAIRRTCSVSTCSVSDTVRAAVRAVAALLVAVLLVTASGGRLAAHTEADLVAVPAGSEATVTFRPTHGCGDSPTVEVRVRVPVADASAQSVDGWTETVEPGDDPAMSTVLTWSGGSLPADQAGAFPLAFTVPDQPGVLLTFPAIQRCADGQELAWISGDPTSPTPAPRLLVLPAGSPPAASIDEVAPDAPGRDQLVAIVDVDGPGTTTPPEEPNPSSPPAPETTEGDPTAPPATTSTSDTPSTLAVAEPIGTAAEAGSGDDTATTDLGTALDDAGDADGSGPVVLVVVAVLAAIGAAAAVVIRRRSVAR
jgi:uncharacterized protein YcnI